VESFQGSRYDFGCLPYPEILVPLRQILFLKTTRIHSEPNHGKRVGAPFELSIVGP
jgi:hypothetical protein